MKDDERRPVEAPSEPSAKKTESTIPASSDSTRYGSGRLVMQPTVVAEGQVRLPLPVVSPKDRALALDAARQLVKLGIPVFLAKPDLDPFGQWLADGGHRKTG